MPKSIEDIDRQIAALKEQKKRQQAQIAQKKREGLRSCKELIGEEVVNAFNNWTSTVVRPTRMRNSLNKKDDRHRSPFKIFILRTLLHLQTARKCHIHPARCFLREHGCVSRTLRTLVDRVSTHLL